MPSSVPVGNSSTVSLELIIRPPGKHWHHPDKQWHHPDKSTWNVLQAQLQKNFGLWASWMIWIQVNPIPHRGWGGNQNYSTVTKQNKNRNINNHLLILKMRWFSKLKVSKSMVDPILVGGCLCCPKIKMGISSGPCKNDPLDKLIILARDEQFLHGPLNVLSKN